MNLNIQDQVSYCFAASSMSQCKVCFDMKFVYSTVSLQFRLQSFFQDWSK